MSGALILIVEDNPKNLKLTRDVLQFKGYETLEAESAEVGITLARERQPALILMDIQLPGLDGYEATRRIKAKPMLSHIPIIATIHLPVIATRHLPVIATRHLPVIATRHLPVIAT